MNFYTRKRRMPQVIIVSLIDIFAILLIFVIVTTTFKGAQPIHPSVTIKVVDPKSSEPAADAAADKSEGRMVLVLTENDEIILNDKKLTMDELGAQMTKLMNSKDAPKLTLSVDEKMSYKFVINVVKVLKDAGVKGDFSALTDSNQ